MKKLENMIADNKNNKIYIQDRKVNNKKTRRSLHTSNKAIYYFIAKVKEGFF